MKEFELINHYFKGRGITRRDVNLGIGDDCALVTVPANCQLAVTTDTLVAGVHFFHDISPRALGHRAGCRAYMGIGCTHVAKYRSTMDCRAD